MNILNISKKDTEATVILSSDELVKLCNVLYGANEENKDELYYRLYNELMIARDLSQYGHIDNFCLGNIIKCRNNIGNEIDCCLSDKDIAVFNSYIESNDMPVAFGNSDWNNVYSKVVGRQQSAKAKEWQDRCRE